MLLLLLALAVPPAAPAQQADAARAWRIERATVRVACAMTVGGGFEARADALDGSLRTGTAGSVLDGELSLDLRGLETGIGLRDEHMRDQYLEVGRGGGFERAVLSGIRVGDADPATFAGRTPFEGELLLHGVRHTVAGEAVVRREAGRVRVEASFPLALAAYDIPLPQYLGVGVKDQVQVKVSLVATPESAR